MILVRAPLRIPLGGGGTDLPSYYSKFGGSLISVAINKYMIVNANRPVIDDLIRLKYSTSETVEKISQVQHTLIKEALKLTGINKAVELSWIADVPYGTGMGSSGSFLVATLKALHALSGQEAAAEQIADEACHIEIDVLKSSVGKQDQYLAAFGGLTQLEIDRKGRVEVSRPRVSQAILKDLENSFVLFFTGISRSSHQILSKQNRSTNRGDKKVVNGLHFIKEIGHSIGQAIVKGDIKLVGELMDTHWQYKRKLSQNISNDRIDRWYQLGCDAGALGGKIMGAGGGGFLLFCCPGDKTEIRKVMKKEGLRELFVNFDTEGVKILVNF
ncbi:MAG: GHMP kinase [Candidatus Daviesbacteria bacterium GW2011_GWA1_38_7]|nr:MAG: GHMP kinase [Candidatus Daviesbacteria bacterium GW2011_GWA1_38_7]